MCDAAPDDLLSVAQLGFLRLARKDMEGAKPLLERVMQGPDPDLADRVRSALKLPKVLRQDPQKKTREQIGEEAKNLAAKSLEKGYLKDALKYLTIANENDPVDFAVMLKLGWTYNMLRQDEEAVKWFSVARRSPDPAISAEAEKAWKNLRPQFARFRTTTWMFPFYSSRWHDLFAYAQVKTEMRLGKLPIRPYISLRFIGDTQGEAANTGMLGQYLSETSFIAAAGIGTMRGRHARMVRGRRSDQVHRRPDRRRRDDPGLPRGHQLHQGIRDDARGRGRRAFRGDGDGRRLRQPLWRRYAWVLAESDRVYVPCR